MANTSTTMTTTTNTITSIEIRSIKELVDAGLYYVPSIYIRPPNERPNLPCVMNPTTVCESVPVISLANVFGHDWDYIVGQVREACSNWGVFQVTHHCVPTSVVGKIWATTSEFFALPIDEKLSLNSKNPSCPMYFFTGFYKNERIREWKDTLGFKPSATTDTKLIPTFLRDPILNFHKEMENLAYVVRELLASSLELDTKDLQRHFSRQTMGMNYYPTCPQPELTFGLSSHSDFGTITLLMQDVEGLQVKKGDKWINVPVIPNSFVVLLGDQVEILTNGHYKSVEHRALTNTKKPRMSIGCFYGPNDSDKIGPMDKFISDEKTTMYREIMFSDYLKHSFGKELNGKSNLEFSVRRHINVK